MSDADLLKLLNEDDDEHEQDESHIQHIPTQVPMSHGTLEKAYLICDAVRKVGKAAHEWFSFIVASKSDPEYIVRDLLLVNGTKAEPGFVTVDGKMAAKAQEEINQLNTLNGTDYFTIGWLHSHGSGMPGHSFTDINNFAQLLSTVRYNTEKMSTTPFQLIETEMSQKIEDGQLVLSGQEIEDVVIRYGLPQGDEFQELLLQHKLTNGKTKVNTGKFLQDMLTLCEMTTEQARSIGFGYSVVVNDKRSPPYAEIGIVEERVVTGTGKLKIDTEKTNVVAVDVENDVEPLQKEIEAMVLHRVRFPIKKEIIRGDPELIQFPGSVVTPLQPALHLKLEDVKYSMFELTQVFTMQAGIYVARFQRENIKYATYVDIMLEGMYAATTGGAHIPSEFPEVSVWENGLAAVIQASGELTKDENPVREPALRPYMLGTIMGHIHRNLPEDDNDPEIRFMLDFISGNKNEVLETYVPQILALERDYPSIEEPDDTPGHN